MFYPRDPLLAPCTQPRCRFAISAGAPRFCSVYRLEDRQPVVRSFHVPCALKRASFRRLFQQSPRSSAPGLDADEVLEMCTGVVGFDDLSSAWRAWVRDCVVSALGGEDAGPPPGYSDGSENGDGSAAAAPLKGKAKVLSAGVGYRRAGFRLRRPY